jgi:hypothetical protein
MGYKIIKESDHQFVVRSEEQDVLITTSRRKAARTIADATDLLRDQTPDSAGEALAEPNESAKAEAI